MIKVLEQKHYIRICNNCESKLQYDKEDIKHEIVAINESQSFIICPVCGKRLIIGG